MNSKHTKGAAYFYPVGHEYRMLTNDGGLPIMLGNQEAAKRICVVDCQDKFKRGQGYASVSEEREANAALIAEAFTVASETNRTPRELATERAELLEALKDAANVLRMADRSLAWNLERIRSRDRADALISKCSAIESAEGDKT